MRRSPAGSGGETSFRPPPHTCRGTVVPGRIENLRGDDFRRRLKVRIIRIIELDEVRVARRVLHLHARRYTTDFSLCEHDSREIRAGAAIRTARQLCCGHAMDVMTI